MSTPQTPTPPPASLPPSANAQTVRTVGIIVAVLAVVVAFYLWRMHSDPRHVAAREVDRLSGAMIDLRKPLQVKLTTLQIQVAEGALEPGMVREALELSAQDLDATDYLRGATLMTQQQLEATRYFDGLDAAIAAATQWPSDRPPAVYAALAREVVKRSRADYADAIKRNLSPSEALSDAYSVTLWTSGKTDSSPEAVNNPFHDDDALIGIVVEGLLPHHAGPAAR